MIKPAELTPRKITLFRKKILSWGKNNYAKFPWRNHDKPFHSLIVEILLQRTKAEQVVPVYREFIKEFPSPQSLSNASIKDIEKIIYPLGLKWRAANIVKFGRDIYSKYKGLPPLYSDGLLRLPGVGHYAAGAYLSLHNGVRAIIPDANMVRILGRVFGFTYHAETRKDRGFLSLCERVTPKRKFKEFNYAVIDFGREICTPKNPKHSICPSKNICCYYKKIRSERMSLFENFNKGILSPARVIDEAIKRKLVSPYDKVDYLKKNFSRLVEELQIDAYNLYLKAEEKEGSRAIRDHLSKKVSPRATSEEIIEEAAKMFKELDRFFLSLTQSRRPRAGKAFEVILKTLFKKLNYPFDEQQVINGKPDFLMPGREYYNRNAMDCIIFTAKRTLRERWRQIVTEGTRGLGFYLATIDEKISKNGLDEMRKHRIYLVIPERIKSKNSEYHRADNVITFEDFFRYHLDPAVKRWKAKKII